MLDSLLINTPVSSPLHAQLNLPLLQAHLAGAGFKCKSLDTNIEFFLEFLGEDCPRISLADCEANPLQILSYYNELERMMLEKSRTFDNLAVGLRSLSMGHDRVQLDGVLRATRDPATNPFIGFYERVLEREFAATKPRIIGIAITFQDQVIPAFTLAAVIRQMAPEITIVLGGQMVTRCHDSMTVDTELKRLFDYLILWDGEAPLLELHRRLLRGAVTELVNIVPSDGTPHQVVRRAAAIKGSQLPSPDFSDFNFSDYLFPEMLIPLQTTRGCYARCSFCAIPYGSNRYRVRAAEAVADEIERIQDMTSHKYGRPATYFKFMEDTSAPSTLLHLAEQIEKRGLTAKWETFARLEKAFAEEGMLELLYAGGCRKIHWGLETNDPDILDGMNKKTPVSYSDRILRLSGAAGILNFCFILVGFPGETPATRQRLVDYIAGNEHIHTLTVASFDLTRNSPMDENFEWDNEYGLERQPTEGFQVRVPYQIKGGNWKQEIVIAAHEVLSQIVRRRPDIGFVTLFPDQIRGMFCDKYGNDWGRTFVRQFGEENVREMLANVDAYVENYRHNRDIDLTSLPEPLKREHLRTKEDLALLAEAVLRRREYEARRIEQV